MHDGWVETTLDGIAEFINGYPFKPADLGETGMQVIRIKQLLDPTEPVDRTETETPDRYNLKNGDIVFSWSGTLAVRVWNRGPAKLNQHLFKVIEKKGIHKSFVPLILGHAIEELEGKSHGTTMKHITKQTLLPHKVLLPSPQEQKRIVDLIAGVDAYIETLQQQLETAKKSRNAMLHELIDQGGFGWGERSLGQVSKLQMGRTPSRREPRYWTEDLHRPFCTIADMQSKFVDPSREGITELAVDDGKAKVAREGTLLMSFKLTIGRVGFAARDIYPNEAIVMIEADETEILKEFLYLSLGSMDLSAGSGRAVKGATLNSVSLAAIRLSIPPIYQQEQIVALISSMDEARSRLEATLSEAKTLRSALLPDLLSGNHVIPETYDELIGAA